MRRILQFIGTITFFCAWPAFWIYYRLGRGRTRVIVQRQGKVLVMKQWISPGAWGLPGGGRHKGESALDGVLRELREETNLRLKPEQLQFIGKGIYKRYGLSFAYDVFSVNLVSGVGRAQRIEISELAWLEPRQLTTHNTSPDTLQCLQIARDQGILLQ